MQNSANSYGMNQQGTCGQNHFGQPMQQDPFVYNHQQQNLCPQNVQSIPCNPCLCTPGTGQSHMTPCNSFLPQNILDQIRTCVGNSAPIFILPNSQPIIAPQQLPQVQQNPLAPQMPINMGFPHTGYPSSIEIGYPGMAPNPIFSPPCYPFSVPLPVCNPFGNQNHSQIQRNSTSCEFCRRNNAGNNCGVIRNSGNSSSIWEENEVHRCCPGSDDTVCTKANCPASINLQALASQLLSVQGVIPCAATRLVLRKVPGSNVTTTVEDTMERAQRSIGSLTKEQLITEARNAQQVNGLINLHMMASPPQNIIPVLTMLQLKVNSLKALVENLVNKNVSECQSVGAQGNTSLEPMILTIKSNAELRELLATLRQKECEERVNVNYAPYHSQRIVAESRLANFQNKISQVETEMEKRRAAAMPWANSTGQFNQASFSVGKNYHSTIQEGYCTGSQGFNPLFDTPQVGDAGGKGFDSPNPFMVQVQSPRRLNLKPNVGGPQTTYHQSIDEQTLPSPQALAVRKWEEDTRGCCDNQKSCFREEQENTEPSRETSDPEKSSTEGKKKLKIHIDNKGELSVKKKSLEELNVGEFVQLSPEVVIVIDKVLRESKHKEKSQERLKKKNKKKGVKKKSEESVPSDSTFDSETSVSSRSSEAEENEEPRHDKKRSKSSLKNVSKGKKKTTDENDVLERISHDVAEPNDEVKLRSIKKEKHVNVAMLSDLSCDQFISRNIDNYGRESVSLSENRPGRSLAIEGNADDQPHISNNQEELNIDRENADDFNPNTASKEICSIMKDTSSNSIISLSPKLPIKKSSSPLSSQFRGNRSETNGNDVERNCNLEELVESLLKDAQNQTLDDHNRCSIIGIGDITKGRRRRDKDNLMEKTRTCTIVGKKNKDNQTLQSSITNSMDDDQRKKHNYRFK